MTTALALHMGLARPEEPEHTLSNIVWKKHGFIVKFLRVRSGVGNMFRSASGQTLSSSAADMLNARETCSENLDKLISK